VKLKGQFRPSRISSRKQDPYKTLLNYRNTPLDGINLSPAHLLMGRRLKSSLPTKVDLLKPQRSQEIQQQFQKRKEREKFYYDQHSGKELPPLTLGDKVSMDHENEWIQATVVNKYHTPRSYVVQTPNGKFYRRNRRLLCMRVSQAKNKETDATQIAQPQIRPLFLLQLVSKADLVDQEQPQIMVHQQKFVPGQVWWLSNPNT